MAFLTSLVVLGCVVVVLLLVVLAGCMAAIKAMFNLLRWTLQNFVLPVAVYAARQPAFGKARQIARRLVDASGSRLGPVAFVLSKVQRALQDLCYLSVAESQSSYEFASVAQKYSLPQAAALETISECLQQMSGPVMSELSDLRWVIEQKAGNEIIATIQFTENAEPALRVAYESLYFQADPLVCGFPEICQRRIKLTVLCNPVGAGSTKVSYNWDVYSPRIRTTCGDLIARTITSLDMSLRLAMMAFTSELRGVISPSSGQAQFWPCPQDYNEAIQNPQNAFKDPELKSSKPELNALGLPSSESGAFASVYKVTAQTGKQWAVRCFLRPVTDQQERYRQISQFINSDKLESTIAFEYQSEAILVNRHFMPVVKMDWVDGQTLSAYIEDNLNQAQTLKTLAADFADMVGQLHDAGIAHGDLQHANILVTASGLKLVDYDGMYVPALSGFPSNELGHRNYQHPGRSTHDFGAFLDNFPAWVIYLSIICLAEDPDLWTQLGGGDECLLLRQADYANPSGSAAFSLLANHQSEIVRSAGKHLLELIDMPVETVPPLTCLTFQHEKMVLQETAE